MGLKLHIHWFDKKNEEFKGVPFTVFMSDSSELPKNIPLT